MLGLRLSALLLASLAGFPAGTDAFWRMPCRGQTGFARMDPIVDPGKVSSHVHAVHGGGGFAMTSDTDSLRKSECTSCAVTQDKSAYWIPTLYFIHSNGTAEMVKEVGGMLAYYLLYGDKPKAFPKGFRMLAGDPFLRNFTWPVPDPPKSEWHGEQSSQRALAQKALGFNCMNYGKQQAEPSLGRHFMPNKTFLDENCPDGLRLELQFPSCWNGKDHGQRRNMPPGFETRLVSLFFENIFDTGSFKDYDGYFSLSNGDPTGYGYHGDFIFGWEDGVLEQAVEQCTDESGLVDKCKVFDLQPQSVMQQCKFEMPEELKDENVMIHEGLPGPMTVAWGPEYAMGDGMHMGSSATSTAPGLPGIPTLSVPDISLSLGLSIGGHNLLGADSPSTSESTPTTTATPTTTSTPTSTATPTPTPSPTTSYAVDSIPEEIIYLEKDVVVLVNQEGVPYSTETRGVRTVSTAYSTASETSTVVYDVPVLPEPTLAGSKHARRHVHYHHARHHGF
ncbi:hypothetical protein N7512_003575 [Penicillium capsulatum]|nr:hypothetical protein N7512_003575 [Penicillium capsulatum]